ncbi:hypothetical protein [Mesorhizobium muleiense]|uniref:hypothetical protein n=1 Tax=Mesorhizobium muleiense TaxID=1004279 RepID=UPI001F25A4C5|nr:hypothetical protein [Mesorhizobium muleiense]MCF6112251.1 hypothetical protein [Mesorhizobium muleiense]MCF6118594.1 hypothetical protein [Mesorhizobium muleiense]
MEPKSSAASNSAASALPAGSHHSGNVAVKIAAVRRRMIPKNEKSYFWGSCAKIKVLQRPFARARGRAAL